MARPDLNLLVTLDVLLAEGSVARAARRLRLSPSAMSRALARLREATGDPLLAKLLARISTEAPGVRLRFLPKPDKDSAPLRDGTVDLETGVVGKTTGPEVRTQALFRDRFIGVVRTGHPLSKGDITPERYAAGRHIRVSRRGIGTSPIDEALAPFALECEIATIVGGFSAALALARASDLVASVPERHTGDLRSGMHSFALPMPVPPIAISQLWHPRLDGDVAHRWLRGCVREACAG